MLELRRRGRTEIRRVDEVLPRFGAGETVHLPGSALGDSAHHHDRGQQSAGDGDGRQIRIVAGIGLEPPIAGAEPRISSKQRVEPVPVRTHSVTANDVVDRKAGGKERYDRAEQERDEIEIAQILNKL